MLRGGLIMFLYDHHFTQLSLLNAFLFKVRKMAKLRNRCNQAPHLTEDTTGKVTKSKLDITNESQEVSLFPAGDHKADDLL